MLTIHLEEKSRTYTMQKTNKHSRGSNNQYLAMLVLRKDNSYQCSRPECKSRFTADWGSLNLRLDVIRVPTNPPWVPFQTNILRKASQYIVEIVLVG